TVSPPSTSSLPLASRSCTVMVAAPSVVMASGSAVMVDGSGVPTPALPSREAVVSMPLPLTVPEIVTSPGVFGSKVAMYAPPPVDCMDVDCARDCHDPARLLFGGGVVHAAAPALLYPLSLHDALPIYRVAAVHQLVALGVSQLHRDGGGAVGGDGLGVRRDGG